MCSASQITDLTIPSSTKHLEQVRDTVRDCISQPHIPESLASQLILAVDEALANIILHSCGNHSGVMIAISIATDDEKVQVTLRNKGPYFDPATFPEPDIEIHLRNGTRPSLGIHLLRNILDDMQYSHNDGLNELVLIKHLTKPTGIGER